MIEGFDYGRFATAVTCSEKVVIELTSLREIPTLVERATEEQFRACLKEDRIEFLVHPDLPAMVEAPNPHLAIMTFPANARDLYKDESSRLSVLADSFQRNPLVDIEISSETAALIASCTRVTPPGLQERLISDMSRDLVDIRFRGALDQFAKAYFKADVSPLSYLRTVTNGTRASVMIDVSSVPSEQRINAMRDAQSLVLILAEAYKQYALAATIAAASIYSDEDSLKAMQAFGRLTESVPATDQEGALQVVTRSARLPDLGWLVNRGVLALSDAISFARSKDGSEFRAFLARSAASGVAAEDVEKRMQDAIIQSFHNKTSWEKAWESNAGQVARLTITQLPSLIPGAWGAFGGLMASLADMGLPKVLPQEFRPTLVVGKALREYIDNPRLEIEGRRAKVFPSLAKLQKMGFEATLAMKLPDDWICLVLDKPGVEEAWHLRINLKEEDARIYYSAFEALLPPPGSKSRRLVDALGDGMVILRIQTTYKAGPPASINLVYTLRAADGTTITIEDDSIELSRLYFSRSYLRNPDAYAEFHRKVSAPRD